ncbi:hypothetical protein [Fervidicola ferrireducens]|nr:hypothetical protein [Fervidicola ferrireducens]
MVDVPLFWKLEISQNPNRCVVTRRKLLSWETTTIDGFIDFGYVKGWFGYIRMTDTDWLVFIKHENGNHKLVYAVELQSWSTKKIVEEIADYLGWGGEYREYEVYPLKYGVLSPNYTHLKNIVLACCIIPVIEPHPVLVMLGILGIAWLFIHETAI